MTHFSLHSLALILVSSYASSLLMISCAAALPVLKVPDVLLSFKSPISDPLGSLASWNDNGSLHYCMWRGVTCGRRHPLQVVALNLNSLGLAGPISPIVSNLTFLRRLHLQDNQLQGSIPEELGRLSRLRHLNLSVNSLQGEIPPSLSHCSDLQTIGLEENRLSGVIPSNLTRCYNLQILNLAYNMIGGEIPTDISSLPVLEELVLGGNSLFGRIPPLLGSSPSLTYVGLWNNSLTGGIPSFLANSSTLQILRLQGNNLTGGIPPSLCNSTSLTELDLFSNSLTGGIPSFGMNPSQLSFLALARNSLTGGIPSSLGNLSSLHNLFLGENSLEGSIPESLSTIPSMQEMDVSENRLSSRIPSSLYNLSTLALLGVGNNMLSGTLPPNFGLTLPNLYFLELANNQFEGPIPVSLSNASGLAYFFIDNNSFSGMVPSNLGFLPNLYELDMGYNQLQSHGWSFLSSLTNCTLLEILVLDHNNLEGPLPSSVGNLSTRLYWLDIGKNPISGIIPAEIGNLVNLRMLRMDQSHLVGSIPATIGELQSLNHLDLSENNLSGSIPSAIGNLPRLSELRMQENNLSGTIPPSIGGCTSLSLLNLSHNALEGTIPRELLSLSSLAQYLDLSYNSLIGSIPMEVAHLINLGTLDVSENQLSGDIPPALSACQLLEQLHMEGNYFQGNIPQTFVNLKGLKELDLSRNNLSGRIPDFFDSFTSLRTLNLSFNDFEGEVPSGSLFRNASEIFVLGNKKLCGDYPELQLPSCSTHDHARRISNLEVILISAVSAVIILLLSLFGILYMRRKAIIRGTSPTSSFEGEKYRKVSYFDIYKATDGFSTANLVGAGSFGSVYKGKIDAEESNVVVKVLNLNQKGSSKSFTAECEALRNIRHRNLIKIITACSSVDHKGNDFKALVFEYMPNGSLAMWLHTEVGLEPPRQPRMLTLIQRLNIAIDVASALDYLHHNCQPPVVHCDLKPSNILLDDDMKAYVGDFGLAKLLSISISATNNSTSSIGIKGSIGYIAPEYGIGGQVSSQGDVYSFGILLLEMMTGKKPTDDMFKDGLNIRRYVEMSFLEDDMKFLDPRLVLRDEGEAADSNIMNENITRERSTRCIFSLVRIGLLCSNDAPGQRMEMEDVAREIRTIKRVFSMVEAHGGGNTVIEA